MCRFDYVEIRDGGDVTSTKLGRFCGSTKPNDIKSTGNQLFVRFHSNDWDQSTGFNATSSAKGSKHHHVEIA